MTTTFAGQKHLAGCQCAQKTCRAAYAVEADRCGAVTLRRTVLARFETLLAMRDVVAEVSVPYARAEADGQVLIVQCTPQVLNLLSAAGKLPAAPTTPAAGWGKPRVRCGPRSAGTHGSPGNGAARAAAKVEP